MRAGTVFSRSSRRSCCSHAQSDCANLTASMTIAWVLAHLTRLMATRARVGSRLLNASIARRTKMHRPKPQASARPTSRAQSILQSRRKKRTFHHTNLASATRSVRRARHLALPPRLKFVYHLQMSRPSVRRDDQVAYRSPACACSECKRRVPSQRVRLHVEISRNNTCTLHCGALQVCYLSVIATNDSATSGMQVVYSAKLCKTIVMNNQAVAACPVRFKIFYRLRRARWESASTSCDGTSSSSSSSAELLKTPSRKARTAG